jgi:hypothetical protein
MLGDAAVYDAARRAGRGQGRLYIEGAQGVGCEGVWTGLDYRVRGASGRL